MTDVERLREELYAWCGRNPACKRAVDYYIMLLQNPCYPPSDKMTYKKRRFYMEIIKKHGLPPRCDVRKLVEERLRGTALEKYVGEIAELAELARKKLHVASRTAAAAATVVVAEWHGRRVVYNNIAALFGVSYVTVRTWLKAVHALYVDVIVARNMRQWLDARRSAQTGT